MKAIVTGGAGFIGSHLVEKLIHEGHEVHVIDNLSGGRLNNLKECLDHPLLHFHHVDIRDEKILNPLFESIDWVFHLAGLADIVPSIDKPRDYYEVNVNGTFNVLEAAKSARCKKIIYAASSSCYGLAKTFPTPETSPVKPEYPYALTKFLGEELVMHYEKVYRMPSISLRLFNVYGPRARTTGAYGAVFGVFLAQKLHNQPFTVVGDGTQTRDFTYVTDVRDAFYMAAKSSITGEIFNVGSSGHYSVNELVALLKGPTTFLPKRPGEPDCTFADVSKIEKMLGWKAKTSFAQGVNNLLSKIEDFKDAPLWTPESIEKATKTWFDQLNKKASLCS